MAIRWIAASLAAVCALSAAACGETSGVRDEGRSPAPSRTAGGSSVKIWLLRYGQLAPVSRQVPVGSSAASAALDALLAGPTPAERLQHYSTMVPPSTERLGFALIPDQHLAWLDLSRPFSGRPATMTDRGWWARIGQVVYTLTQFSGIDSVSLRVEHQITGLMDRQGNASLAYMTRSVVDSWVKDLPSPVQLSCSGTGGTSFTLTLPNDGGAVPLRSIRLAGTAPQGLGGLLVRLSQDGAPILAVGPVTCAGDFLGAVAVPPGVSGSITVSVQPATVTGPTAPAVERTVIVR